MSRRRNYFFFFVVFLIFFGAVSSFSFNARALSARRTVSAGHVPVESYRRVVGQERAIDVEMETTEVHSGAFVILACGLIRQPERMMLSFRDLVCASGWRASTSRGSYGTWRGAKRTRLLWYEYRVLAYIRHYAFWGIPRGSRGLSNKKKNSQFWVSEPTTLRLSSQCPQLIIFERATKSHVG